VTTSAERAWWGVSIAVALIFSPALAHAYVGPGLGLGAIGSVFSLIGAVLLGIVGFVWYPIKRLLRAFRKPKTNDE
jgi:hypothetical protein